MAIFIKYVCNNPAISHLHFLCWFFHWILVSKCIVNSSFQNDNYTVFSWAAKAKTTADIWIWKNLTSFTIEYVFESSRDGEYRVFYFTVSVSWLKTLIQWCPRSVHCQCWLLMEWAIGHRCTEVEQGGNNLLPWIQSLALSQKRDQTYVAQG